MDRYPKNCPPPSGYRKKRILRNGDFTRRDPESGPYGVFISSSTGKSKTCLEGERQSYMTWWRQATPDMKVCLWGNKRERQSAEHRIRDLNKMIRDFNGVEGRDAKRGVIDVSDWSMAGEQLEKAIRDVCLYNSTARFEDVRDFIWERIQNRSYPIYWEVKWDDFITTINDRRDNFENIRNGNPLDDEDGAYRFYEQEPASSSATRSRTQASRPGAMSQRSTRRRDHDSTSMQERAGVSRRVGRQRPRIRLENLESHLESSKWRQSRTLR